MNYLRIISFWFSRICLLKCITLSKSVLGLFQNVEQSILQQRVRVWNEQLRPTFQQQLIHDFRLRILLRLERLQFRSSTAATTATAETWFVSIWFAPTNGETETESDSLKTNHLVDDDQQRLRSAVGELFPIGLFTSAKQRNTVSPACFERQVIEPQRH